MEILDNSIIFSDAEHNVQLSAADIDSIALALIPPENFSENICDRFRSVLSKFDYINRKFDYMLDLIKAIKKVIYIDVKAPQNMLNYISSKFKKDILDFYSKGDIQIPTPIDDAFNLDGTKIYELLHVANGSANALKNIKYYS